jgi:hypothetical protein
MGKGTQVRVWLDLPNPGYPSTGMGYLFYVILRIISYIVGESKTRDKKYGKIALPMVLSFIAFIMVTLIILLSR